MGRSEQVSMGDSTYPGPLGRANSILSDNTRGPQSPAQTGYAGQALAAQLLTKLFKQFDDAHCRAALERAAFHVAALRPERGGRVPSPPFALCFERLRPWLSMVLGETPLRLAEAYFRGEIDIEGDLFAALGLRDHWRNQLPLRER